MDCNDPSEPYFVGVDVGGTNIKAGVVNDHGEPLSHISFPTEATQGAEAGIVRIFRAVEEAVGKSTISLDAVTAIGLATPGPMDIPAGKLLEPPNLPGWQGLPIRQRVADHFKKPTVLQNDANAAAYGEYWFGAGKDAHSLVFWTLGTGIGCGIIIDNVIVEGEHSHGAECGHIIIQMDSGRHCETGQSGTLEAYASATALISRCRDALNAGRESLLKQNMSANEQLTPLLIAEAAEAGDKLADELIMETARCMGIGTTTVMHTINPNIVFFGGSMTFGRNDTQLGRRFLQRIKDEVETRTFPVLFEKTVIDYATLGGSAGYIGAAGCARLKFGRDLR